MTGKNVSAEALEGLLMDAKDALDVFTTSAASNDDEESDASDCIAGCDPLDVEVSDAGDTGADETEETHDDGGPLSGLLVLESAALSGICSINCTMCLVGCTLEALSG
jgi:hypothetical protein